MFEIIPAIDIRGGRCVRLFQGDYSRETVYGDDPVAMARHWQRLGARRLHIVDLDGARQGAPAQLDLVARIARAVDVPIQLGGGLRTTADIAAALAAGVERVVVGTAAIQPGPASDPPAFRRACREQFGARVVLGLDARGGQLAVRGWTETTVLDVFAFARLLRDEGFERIVYTDISRDGALSGPNVDDIKRLAAIEGLAVIASGGIHRVDDLLALAAAGAEAAIVGTALYQGAIDLPSALAHLSAERHV